MRNLLILIDGVGYEQLTECQPPGLMSIGSRLGFSPVQTMLSFSSGIYCSIWSGLKPEDHGIWTEYYRGSDDRFRVSSLFRPLPGKFLPRALSYLALSGLSRLGWKGRENCAIPPGLQSCFRRVGSDYRQFPPVPVRPQPDFAVRLERSRHSWKFVYGDPLDHTALSLVHQAAETEDTLIIALPEMDHAGHLFGPASEEYRGRLLEFDRHLMEMIQSLEQAGHRFSLFLFSDHGMTRVIRSFDVWSYLEKTGFRLGKDYLAFLNSTIVQLWFDWGHRREITDWLNQSGSGHVLSDPEIERFGLRFPGTKFGEAWFLAYEGVEFVPNFINLAHKQGKGLHGYNPDVSSTRAFFIGEEQIVDRPEDILGIHRVLEEVMLG